MRIVPQAVADLDEYPEIQPLGNAALRRVAELMGVHDILEIRRLRKTGLFEHPYTKDVVIPIGIPVTPPTVQAVRHAVGKALLDYLEAVGFSGLRLEVTQEDTQALAALWAPPEQPAAAPGSASLDPQPADPGAEPHRSEDNLPPDGDTRRIPEPGAEPAAASATASEQNATDKEQQHGNQ